MMTNQWVDDLLKICSNSGKEVPLSHYKKYEVLNVVSGVKVDTVDLYGVPLKGEIISTMKNVVVVEDASGKRHVVHKENIGRHKRVKTYNNRRYSYDREEVEKYKKRPTDRGRR